MYRKLVVFIQALAAFGILVIAVITLIGQSTGELRIEMQEEFRTFRTAMQEEFRSLRTAMREEHAAIRIEMREEHAAMREEHAAMREEHAAIREDIHPMNKRLGRLEGVFETLTERPK